MPSDTPKGSENARDAAIAETFPASDPPATTAGETHARAVPPQEMMGTRHKPPFDAVTLRRRFPSAEAAKLALESLVRDGPVDRDCAELAPKGQEVELLVHVSEEDCHRIRGLLAHV